MQNKVIQAESKIFKRSEIQPATYNARKITDEARKELKKNIKANGLLGGVLINIRNGNIVSGHQRVDVMDEINRYNEGEKDYELKADYVDVDDKTEKELNISLNSRKLQGEYDYAKLALMIPDIDVNLAGLDEVDMSFIDIEMPTIEEIVIPSFEPQKEKKDKADEDKQEDNSVNHPATSVLKEEMTDEEKKAHVKAIKEKVKENSEYLGEPYFTVSFDSYENKAFFLERFQIGAEARYIKGEELAEKLDEMYES